MKGLFASVLLLLTFLVAHAQPRQGEVYRIKQEDLLRIQVFNQQQVSADVPVGQDGNVQAPFAGTIRAEGRTTTELEEELVSRYRKILRLRQPIVSVSILRYRPVRASIGGMVQRAGTYEVRPGDTLLSLLNQGGGPIPDRADLRRAYLQRADSNRELIPIDLHAMLIRGDTSQNYEIQDGDTLTIPEETQNFVNVQGKVQAPGRYPYREPMTLSDAISLARGETPRSRMSRIVIARQKVGQPGEYVRINADYVRFVRQGDATQNIVLQPGDYVYVPETNTPDFGQISALANVAFILDRFGGGLFGLRLFSR